MIKDIIFEQKKEIEKKFSQKYILRTKLQQAKKYLKNDLIKVITGPRRAGKSVFALELLKDVDDYAYINFDDEALLKNNNSDEILNNVLQIYKNPRYIFIDEVQNLPNWELFINKLHRKNFNLILTGSNAKLLSKELASALTGRHIPIEILPFNFAEYLDGKDINISSKENIKIKSALIDYLKNGSYPEIVVKNLEVNPYLNTLFDSIILKDIIQRYKIRHSETINELGKYLLNIFSSEYSFTKLKNILEPGSIHTIQKYTKYLEETYLFFTLNRFSFKVKEQIKSPKKIYIVDNGLISAKTNLFSENYGKLMENSLFVELLKRGYEVNHNLYYYKTRNQKEIDFVLTENRKVKSLIQSCYSINLDSEKREINALLEASEELHCQDLKIITWDIEKIKKIEKLEIQYIPYWKWLLQN